MSRENGELDCRIAREVMGWDIIGRTDDWSQKGFLYMGGDYGQLHEKLPDGRYHQVKWSPSTSIADAFLVVEKMKERDFYFSAEWDCNDWAVNFADDNDSYCEIDSKSLPMAICLAALSALSALKPETEKR